MLVSHWAVDSDTTVRLITGTVGEIARDAEVGRAEALRRAMLALIDNGAQHEAHPSYWAPFVVVGEGAARWRGPHRRSGYFSTALSADTSRHGAPD